MENSRTARENLQYDSVTFSEGSGDFSYNYESDFEYDREELEAVGEKALEARLKQMEEGKREDFEGEKNLRQNGEERTYGLFDRYPRMKGETAEEYGARLRKMSEMTEEFRQRGEEREGIEEYRKKVSELMSREMVKEGETLTNAELLKRYLSRIAETKKELAELEEHVKHNPNMQGEYEDAKRTLEDMQSKRETIARLMTLEQKEAKLNRRQKIELSEADGEKIKTLKTKHEAASGKIKDLETERSSIKKEIDKLVERGVSGDELSKKVAEYRAKGDEIGRLKIEMDNLKFGAESIFESAKKWHKMLDGAADLPEREAAGIKALKAEYDSISEKLWELEKNGASDKEKSSLLFRLVNIEQRASKIYEGIEKWNGVIEKFGIESGNSERGKRIEQVTKKLRGKGKARHFRERFVAAVFAGLAVFGAIKGADMTTTAKAMGNIGATSPTGIEQKLEGGSNVIIDGNTFGAANKGGTGISEATTTVEDFGDAVKAYDEMKDPTKLENFENGNQYYFIKDGGLRGESVKEKMTDLCGDIENSWDYATLFWNVLDEENGGAKVEDLMAKSLEHQKTKDDAFRYEVADAVKKLDTTKIKEFTPTSGEFYSEYIRNGENTASGKDEIVTSHTFVKDKIAKLGEDSKYLDITKNLSDAQKQNILSMLGLNVSDFEGKDFLFAVREKCGQIGVFVVDKETGEVEYIKKTPKTSPEEGGEDNDDEDGGGEVIEEDDDEDGGGEVIKEDEDEDDGGEDGKEITKKDKDNSARIDNNGINTMNDNYSSNLKLTESKSDGPAEAKTDIKNGTGTEATILVNAEAAKATAEKILNVVSEDYQKNLGGKNGNEYTPVADDAVVQQEANTAVRVESGASQAEIEVQAAENRDEAPSEVSDPEVQDALNYFGIK